MNNTKKQSTLQLEKMIGISIFSALAYTVALICTVIPKVQGFLSLDLKDAVIAIAAFIYGPISGVAIAFIAAFIEFLTFSTTAWYGLIMNFASSAVFTLTASTIYKKFRTINGAIGSFAAAVIATTGVMLLLNTFITPIYLTSPLVGMPEAAASEMVRELLGKILLPFNFAKALLNAAVSIMLYKPVLSALSKAKIIKTKSASLNFNRNTIVVLALGLLALIVSVTIYFIIK